jgi:hypothetical protein
LPSIETDILPRFAPADVQVVVAHCYTEGESAAAHVQWFGLTFPIALDFDSELFRRFRLPGQVFPLNFVLDRDGRVAYLGPVLDDAVAAVEALLP